METLRHADILKLYEEDGKSLTEIGNILLEKSNKVERSSKKFNIYYQRVKRIIETVKKLRKGKSRKEGAGFLNEFLDRIFEFPKLEEGRKSLTQGEIEALKPSESTSAEIISDLTTQLKSEKSSTISLTKELKKKSEIVKQLQHGYEKHTSCEKQLKQELKRVKQREIYHRDKVQKLEKTEPDTEEKRVELEKNFMSLFKRMVNLDGNL